jgi:hypothetical protein
MNKVNELFPISVAGKWGYIDLQGNVAIEPQFEKASKFREGLAAVTVAGTSDEDAVFERKYQGFIGRDGKFLIPPKPPSKVKNIENYQCYSYGDFHEGLARIHINDATGMDGFINRAGKLIVPCKFDTTSDFSEGLAFAETWRAWDDPGPKRAGYIDTKGRFVIENNTFLFGRDFADGHAVVSVRTSDDGRSDGLIDKKGNYVIPPGTYSGLSSLIAGAMRGVRDGNVGMLDVRGRVIVPFGKYESILEPCNGNIFTAESGRKAVLLDSTGKRIAVASTSNDVGRFSGGMATIRIRNRFGYIDTKGEMRIAPRFSAAERFDRGLALVTLRGTKGYINLQGDFVWKEDHWNPPLRNSVSKPLLTFLPESKLEALPLSYNWERVKNAIVFAANGSLKELHSWCKRKFSRKGKILDGTDFDVDPYKLDLTIFRSKAGHVEVYAMAGTGDKGEVKAFVNFYCCRNMSALHRRYPKKIVGILIEN